MKHWFLRKVWGVVVKLRATSKYDVFSFLIRIKGSNDKVPSKIEKYLVIPWSHCNKSTFLKAKNTTAMNEKKSGNSCKDLQNWYIKTFPKKHVEPPATGWPAKIPTGMPITIKTSLDWGLVGKWAFFQIGEKLTNKNVGWIYGLPLHPDGFLWVWLQFMRKHPGRWTAGTWSHDGLVQMIFRMSIGWF